MEVRKLSGNLIADPAGFLISAVIDSIVVTVVVVISKLLSIVLFTLLNDSFDGPLECFDIPIFSIKFFICLNFTFIDYVGWAFLFAQRLKKAIFGDYTTVNYSQKLGISDERAAYLIDLPISSAFQFLGILLAVSIIAPAIPGIALHSASSIFLACIAIIIPILCLSEFIRLISTKRKIGKQKDRPTEFTPRRRQGPPEGGDPRSPQNPRPSGSPSGWLTSINLTNHHSNKAKFGRKIEGSKSNFNSQLSQSNLPKINTLKSPKRFPKQKPLFPRKKTNNQKRLK